MSTKKFGIVAGIAIALSVVVSPVSAACSLTDMSGCDNTGLMSLIAQLLGGQSTTSTTTTTGTSISGIPAGFTFATNLKQGSTGNDVKYLQVLLNSNSATSIGNAGSETTYFGAMTKAAVVKFQNLYKSEVLTPYGLAAGTGFFGTSTRAKANALIAGGTTTTTTTGGTTTTTTTPTTGAYTVALAANQPTGTLASGSAYNTMLRVNVSAGATAQSITSITVQRTGLSIDSNVDGVLIADEAGTRYGNIVTFANNSATIAFPSTPITVAAGTTKTLLIQYNLVAGALSGTIGANVTAMSGTPTGLPLVGNTMTLADGSLTLGTMNIDVVNLTTATVQKDVGSTGYDLSKFKFKAGSNEEINLKKVTLYQNGTANDSDLTNIKLVAQDGTVLATVASATNKYVVFDLTASPYKIGKGVQKDFTVRVDVANGSQRTAQFIIQNNYDVVATGVNTGMNILPGVVGNSVDTSFPLGDISSPAGATQGYNHMTIAAGNLTVNKDQTTPSGTISIGSSNVTLATFKFEAKGEDIELRSAKIEVNGSGIAATDLSGTIRMVTEDGQTIINTSTTTTNLVAGGGAVITFSPYYVIPSGTTKKISVIVDTSSTLLATDQIYARIGTIYYKKVLTNSYATINDGTWAATGNTLGASQGTLTVARNGSLGSSTKVEGQSEVKIGSYLIQTNSTEQVNVSNISIKVSADDAVTAAAISNLKIKKSDGTLLGSSLSTPTVGTNGAGFNGAANPITTSGQLNIPASTTVQFDVYADIAVGAADDGVATDKIMTEIDVAGVSATGATSGATANAPTTAQGVQLGQTIVPSTGGTLTISAETSGAASAQFLTTGLSGVEMSRIKLAATVEDMKIDRLEVRTVNGDGNVSQVKLLGTGLSTDPTSSLTNGTAVFTFASGSEITVPAYGSKVLTVVADTTNVGTITAGKLGVVGFGTANAKGAGSGNIVQEVITGTAYTVVNDTTFTGNVGDVIYTTTTATNGTTGGTALNTAPGFYMVTTRTSTNLTTATGALVLNGDANDVYWAIGDKVTTLTKAWADTSVVTDGLTNAVAVGDVVYIYQSTTVNGFYVVDNAVAAGTSGAAMINGVTLGDGDIVTKIANANALVGNTMKFEEVEPNMAKNASSPSGSVSSSSEQIVAIFDVTAQGSRDLTFDSFSVEKGGSNNPNRNVVKYSLYNGSSLLSAVTTTSTAGTMGAVVAAGTEATWADLGLANAAAASRIYVGDTLSYATNAAPTVILFTGKVTAKTATGLTFDTATVSVAVGKYYNNRVHFDTSSSATGLVGQTITAGQTLTLTVKADTTNVKADLGAGVNASLTMSIPGSAGPLTTEVGGLNWDYTPLNILGTADARTQADNYPVNANTLTF